MKHVILTFFGLVLVYSLFFNDKKNAAAEKEMKNPYDNSSPSMLLLPDSSYQKFPGLLHFERFVCASE